MALYSKKDFAMLVGIDQKHISTMKSRGKIEYTSDGKMIDSGSKLNRLFIEEREIAMAKEGKMPHVPGSKAKGKTASKDTQGEESEVTDLLELNGKKKALDIDKITEEIKLLRIKHEKAIGEVIPVAPMEPLVYQYQQYILTQNRIAFEKFLILIGHKNDISGEDMADYRGQYIVLLNNAISEANSLFRGDLGKHLSEFTVKKSIGEHG